MENKLEKELTEKISEERAVEISEIMMKLHAKKMIQTYSTEDFKDFLRNYTNIFKEMDLHCAKNKKPLFGAMILDDIIKTTDLCGKYLLAKEELKLKNINEEKLRNENRDTPPLPVADKEESEKSL